MMYYQFKQSGFSLVETLVAISILLIVIVGPMALSMQAAKSSTFATEQIQAFFLAQEGLELAQKARDDIMLDYTNFGGATANPWSQFTNVTGVYGDCFAASGCGLEWDATAAGELETPAACSTIANCRLYLDSTGRSFFTHSASASITPYTRRIYFSDAVAGREIKVTSVVTWRTGSIVAEQRVSTETYLYNIYDAP